jgi:hypothetical protein
MGGKIAGSLCPFEAGFTIGLAIRACRIFTHPVTPFAGLHDGITSPTVVGTAVFLHENAFCSYFYGLTNHGDLPPFFRNFFLNLLKINEIFSFK